jgi:hypothetical protein
MRYRCTIARSRAAENDDHAGETGQCGGDLRRDTKSFARFHVKMLFLL